MLQCVFTTKIPGTKGPNVTLFKSFQKHSNTLYQSKYKYGLAENKIPQKLLKKCRETHDKNEKILCTILPRHDYNELLELCKFFFCTIDAD